MKKKIEKAISSDNEKRALVFCSKWCKTNSKLSAQ